MNIRINEIFQSISGEAGHPSFPQGTFCSFVRFQGCNCQCNWCDTAHSQDPEAGRSMSVGEILSEIGINNYIVITGGEPALQALGLSMLVRALTQAGKHVQIETNGTFIPVDFGENCTWVIDYKLTSSGVSNKMLPVFDFFSAIQKSNSVIKFVFDSIADIEMMFEKIKLFIEMLNMQATPVRFAPFILSPTENGKQYSKKIVQRIFDQNLQEYCVFSLQSHKILNLK